MSYLRDEFYQRLKKDEDLFSFIEQDALDGFCYHNLEQPEEVWLDPKLCQVLGYDESNNSSAPPVTWRAIVHPEDIEKGEAILAKSLHEKQNAFSVTIRYIHKHGHTLSMECKGRLISDEKGKPIRMVGAHTNLQPEPTLTFYKNIVDNQSIFILTVDRKGNYLFVNDYYCTYHHFQKQAIIGKSAIAEVIPEDLEKCYDIFERCFKKPNEKIKAEISKVVEGKLFIESWEFMGIADAKGMTTEMLCIGYDVTEKRKAKETLQENHATLLAILENTEDVICARNQNHELLFYNTAFEKIIKKLFNLDAYVGLRTLDHLPPKAQEYWKPILAKILAGNIVKGEFSWDYGNGDLRHYEISHQPIFKDDTIIGYSEFNRDVTQQKNREIELLKTQKFLQQATQIAKLGAFEMNIQNEMIHYNDIAYEILEIPNDFVPSLEDVLQLCKEGEYREKAIEAARKAITNGESFDVELLIITPKGNEKWLRGLGVVEQENGSFTRIYGSFLDITHQKLAEERLKQFIRDAPTAIVMVDREMKYLAVSEKWIEDYNLPSQEAIIGKSHYEIFPEIREEWKLIHQQCLRGSTLSSEEDKFVRQDGTTTQWIRWKVRPWHTEQGDIGGLMMLSEDITLLKESKEEELRSILTLTQNQNNRLKNFAHIVSHNLRSHAVNIQSLLNLFIEETPTLQEENIMKYVLEASQNLTETIEHLSEIAMLNTDDLKQLDHINLRGVVEKVINSVNAIALNAQVRIINEVRSESYILGLAAYLDSIVLNFLTNAIKYRSMHRDSYVKLTCAEEEEYCLLQIEDNGLGIDLEKYGEKLFGMYKTFHRNPDARGVGLFITKNQIEAIGGKITVTSKVNEGTTFSIYFKKA